MRCSSPLPLLGTLGIVFTLVLVAATAQAQSATFWPPTTVPSVADSGPDNAVELGMQFSCSQAGTVTGLQFYKAVTDTGTHTGHLWSSAGISLASVTFTGETASGWQQANFATPVVITAGTTYTISYHTSVGHYPDTKEFFSDELSVPPLTAPVNAGVYAYGSGSSYPNSVYEASNYWVQPIVNTGTLPLPPDALSALSVSPTSVVGGNSSTGTVTLTSAAPAGGIVVTLSSTNATVPGSVTVVAGSTTATFTVTTPVVARTTLAVITASYDSVNETATLTETAQAQSATFWPPTTVPSVADSGPDNAVELGMQFSCSQAGTVTGLQFYKAATDTGTHTGHLWSSAGISLASVTFTGETASGWQQANFVTPVVITAGTTYTISYHTSVGHYSETDQFFSDELSVPPLTAPVNAGVYAYGSGSSYPNSVYKDSNYWVQPTVNIGPVSLEALSALSVSPTSVVGGSSSTGTVTLTSAAPAGGIVVTLSSTNATVPGSVTVVAGSTTAAFTVTTPVVASTTLAVITASYDSVNETATLTETVVPVIALAISPQSVTLAEGGSQTFMATVTGTASTAVTWSATGGSINSSGSYIAPATAGTYTVTATSNANTAVSVSATVTVTAPVGVAISLTPKTATVNEGGTRQFTATVTGSSNAGVNWSLLSGHGTISSSGLFTAPNLQESDTIQAQSQADTTKTATATATIPAIGVSISPLSATVQPSGTQQFSASVSGTVNQSVAWSEVGKGSVTQAGLYTAPSTNETDTVTVTSQANTAATASASVTVATQSQSACGNTLDWTNSVCQQINGTLQPWWTVISRHGEYAQQETECNVPWAITAGSGQLDIVASAVADTCGDFNTNDTIRDTPSSWPYTTGDIQWNTFNFTYGTVIVNGAMPPSSTSLWPAFWLLGANCQLTNKVSGDTGFGGCPDGPGSSAKGYQEIDMTECYEPNNGGWCQFHVANPSFGIGNGCDTDYAVDGNVHTFMTTWSPSAIKQYMDGALVTTCNQAMPNPMFLIMQIQTGGIAGTPTNLPATMTVNYVKVCNTTDGSCTTVANTDPSVIFYDNFGASQGAAKPSKVAKLVRQ